jgi:hypothetical protein
LLLKICQRGSTVWPSRARCRPASDRQGRRREIHHRGHRGSLSTATMLGGCDGGGASQVAAMRRGRRRSGGPRRRDDYSSLSTGGANKPPAPRKATTSTPIIPFLIKDKGCRQSQTATLKCFQDAAICGQQAAPSVMRAVTNLSIGSRVQESFVTRRRFLQMASISTDLPTCPAATNTLSAVALIHFIS